MPLPLHKASLQQLEIFKSVVENGGFSAAQAALNMSAATISVKMKELEYHLGMPLCQRGRSGFKMTEKGVAAYEATRTLLASFDNFNLAISNIRRELTGEVRIGMQDNLATNRNFKLSESVRLFNQKDNSVIFNIEEASAAEQESRTLDGRYNLAIGLFHHRIPGLSYKGLFKENVALYCAKNHPLFDKPKQEIVMSDIFQSKIISAGTIQQILPANEIKTSPSAVTESMDATVIMMLSGHYLGYLPTHYADIWVQQGLVKPLLFEQTNRTVEFHMITKTNVKQPYVVEVFINDLLSCHESKKE